MTTAPARQAAPGDPAALGRHPAALGRHLDAIAAALDRYGITCQVTRPAGTPVLNTGPPTGPNAATAAIDPDLHASPVPRLDCTCVWTPPAETSPAAAAAVIAAVLNATRIHATLPRQPSHADATTLAAFLVRHPGWSVFWDPRYGLWRAAEDDPGSALYIETSDLNAVLTYITSYSQATAGRPG
jgi:hypothetical protein